MMMKRIYFLMLFVLLMPVVGCNKFLNVAPDVALNQDNIFASPQLAINYANDAYSFLVDDYLRFNACTGTAQASDEAVGVDITCPLLYDLNKGLYNEHSAYVTYGLNDIGGVYDRSYGGIRIVNTMLARMDQIPWANFIKFQQPQTTFPDRIKGEMYFLRAMFYFDLIKRFGGVVLIKQAYLPTDNIDFPRSSYDDCVSFILSDLDQASKLLPLDWAQADYGRPTIGAALALKARLLLYAASPLNNPSNDISKWASAAAAAKAVMDMNKYTLHPNYSELLTPPGNGTTAEYIMIKIRDARTWNNEIQSVVSPGSGGRLGIFNPTQNHVDLYEMANGLPITNPASGYDPNNPYVNRDPRFYANILYNNAPWQGRFMQMYQGGLDYSSSSSAYTATRYYCRKMWPEVYKTPGNVTALVNYIFFRYGEVLLNYAEAQNEAVGADATVYDAINQIRTRAGMPDLPAGLSQSQMRDRIRNERAVELAFEDQRWYDIMRWKTGPQVVAATMYGMNVVKNANGTFTYTKVPLADSYQRVYADYMDRYPIPRAEIQKSKVLVQNPGWQ